MRTLEQLTAELAYLGSDYRVIAESASPTRVEVMHRATGATCSVSEYDYEKKASLHARIDWSFSFQSDPGHTNSIETAAKGKNLCRLIETFLIAVEKYDRETIRPRADAQAKAQATEYELRAALKAKFGLDTSRRYGCYLKAGGEFYNVEQRGAKIYLHLRDIDLATFRVVVAALKGLERKEDEPLQP